MDNNKNLLIGFVGVLVVLIGVLGFIVNKAFDSAASQVSTLGSTLTYSASRGSLETYNIFDGIIADLNILRRPLASISVASSSVSWGTLAAATSTPSSTIINVPGGGTIGDLVLVQPVTAVSSTVVFRGDITATGASANASATISAVVVTTSTNASIGTVTMRVWVFPVSSFMAPASLSSVTTTAANR